MGTHEANVHGILISLAEVVNKLTLILCKPLSWKIVSFCWFCDGVLRNFIIFAAILVNRYNGR